MWIVYLCAFIMVAEPQDVDGETFHHFIIEKVDGDFTARSETRRAYHILSERGGNRAIFFEFDQHIHRIEHVAASVGGKPLDASYKSFSFVEAEHIFISGSRIHRFDFSEVVEPGQTAELVTKRRHGPVHFLPSIRIPNMVHLRAFEVTFTHPEEVVVNFDVAWSREPKPFEIERPSSTKTTIRLENLAEAPSLALFPYNDVHGWIFPLINQGDHAIDARDPVGFAAWYMHSLNALEGLTEDQQTEVRNLMESCPADTDKARMLVNHIHEHFRYIADESGENAHIPHTPQEVFKRRYGDCKDLSLLVRAMGETGKMNVALVLVSTEPRPRVAHVKLDLFDHVIVMMNPEAETPVFCDATRPDIPFGWVPDYLEGKTCLILQDEEHARWDTIPFNRVAPGVDVEIQAHTDQTEKCVAKVRFHGNLAHTLSHLHQNHSALDFENTVSNLVNSLLYKISLDYFVVQEHQEDPHSLLCFAKADLGSYFIQTRRKLYVPKAVFGALDSELLRREDDLHVQLPARMELNVHMELRHPGFEATQEDLVLGSADTSSSLPLAFYSGSLNPHDDASTLHFQFVLSSSVWSGDSLDILRPFAHAYFDLKKSMFSLPRSDE